VALCLQARRFLVTGLCQEQRLVDYTLYGGMQVTYWPVVMMKGERVAMRDARWKSASGADNSCCTCRTI
jgi:hypothetical protein